MAQWQVVLQGHEFDLMDLPRVFHEPPVRVVVEGERFYLEADEFEGLDDPRSVRDAAEKLMVSMNGAACTNGSTGHREGETKRVPTTPPSAGSAATTRTRTRNAGRQ